MVTRPIQRPGAISVIDPSPLFRRGLLGPPPASVLRLFIPPCRFRPSDDRRESNHVSALPHPKCRRHHTCARPEIVLVIEPRGDEIFRSRSSRNALHELQVLLDPVSA